LASEREGLLVLSLGERGCRIRIVQRRPGAVYYRVTWVPAQGSQWASLRTKNRAEAQRRAEALLRALLEDGGPRERRPLTLGELQERYQNEAVGYRENTQTTREGKQGQGRSLLRFFGASKRVEDLCPHDIAQYIEARGSMKRGLPGGSAVRRRTIQADLVHLRTQLNWATTVKVDGEWLLEENPLRGVKFPREPNPRRPVATFDRFEKVREAIQQLAAGAPTVRERDKWIRLELALALAEGTGRRVGSIRQLRWSDISYDPPSIRWRAEFDKKRRERIVPIPEGLASTIKAAQVRLAAVGEDWVFKQAYKDAPWAAAQCQDLLRRAEKAAGLEKLDGGLWHAYRRKWATERKHLPIKDVAAAGGWQDTVTLTTCYQHADEATMLKVMESPVKLVSRRAASALVETVAQTIAVGEK
jgi:integrase